ncbi:MAG: glutamate--tRNA ligase [Thermoguttaceae bacterium]|nr:glutamate--tRNA ligase [Thermoguttaceae bacterium]
MSEVRTRFAPSPTGYMHVGNLRTALYAYLTARHENGTFILRIEDTDQERLVDGAVDIIYDTLKENGMTWDEGPDVGGDYGPYVQSERMGIFKDYALQLVEKGSAYYCFCTEERLAAVREEMKAAGETVGKYDGHCRNLSKEEVERRLAAGEPYVIRQKMPTEGVVAFDDLVYGHIEVDASELEDQILLKSDGMPTYNFANVVDDHLMKISHVIRGNEYLSSAPKYNLLYEAFGWEKPVYIHCPPVMKDAHSKLSKRNGDASYQDLVKQGYLSAAIVNYLLLLGWSPKGDKEIFTREEMIEMWNPAWINKSPAIFDIQKLRAINAGYINRMSDEEFTEIARPWIESVVKSPIELSPLVANLKPRCEILSDLPERVMFIDHMNEDYDLAFYRNKKFKTDESTSLTALKALEPVLEGTTDWTREGVYNACAPIAQEMGVKGGWLLYPLGIALAGTQATPGGGTDLAVVIGKERTLERVRKAIARLSAL